MRKTKFARFGSWLRKQNIVIFSIVVCCIAAIPQIFFMGPVELGWINDIQWRPFPEETYDTLSMISFGLVLAPLIETALFQTVPFLIMWRFRFFKRHRWVMLIIAGALFGSMHYYSLFYIIVTSFVGAILMLGYIVKYKRSPYWCIVTTHFLWNCIAMISQLK